MADTCQSKLSPVIAVNHLPCCDLSHVHVVSHYNWGKMSEKDPKIALKLRPKEGPEVFKDNLIGKSIDWLPKVKLPVKRLILQRIRSLRAQSTSDAEHFSRRHVSDNEIAKIIALETVDIWKRAAIPCKRVDKVKDQVLKCISELSSLMKNWSTYDQTEEPLVSYCRSTNVRCYKCLRFWKLN